MLLGTWFAPSARAEGRFYLEFGGGVSMLQSSATFFGSAVPSTLGLGTALNGALAIKLMRAGAPVDVHLGAAYRYASGSNGTTSYALQGAYPFLRFVFRGAVFLTLGATPYLWKRESTTPGFDGPVAISGRIGALGELGYQWPVTPAVTLALSGALQTTTGPGGLSPLPAFEAGGQIRFHLAQLFQPDGGGDSSSGSGPYDGWRYPYGVPRK